MKNFKYISALLITLSLVFFSLSETISQSNNMKDRFFIGPMNFYFLESLRTQNHLSWYSQLSYNAMQNYCGHFDFLPANWGNQKDGGFFEDTSEYAGYIRAVINQWHDSAQTNSLILEREKILRAAYGQRSTYQAEGVGTWAGQFPAYGYAYSDYDAGHDITDNWMGKTVTSKLCRAGIDSPGFMVKGLVDNCEQTNNTDTTNSNSSGLQERLFSDIKQSNYNHRWYIKPKMRIDSLYAKANPDTAVVMVYVTNFKGDFIDSVLITCYNFLNIIGSNIFYNGCYIENYFNLPHDTTLSVSARILANGKENQPDTASKVDYQIKWLGKVDVWLDYVRVDDSWAHYLFTDTWEEGQIYPDKNIWHFRQRIKNEVTAFKKIPGLAYFWVDECGFNNIPCIAEVNKLVKLYSGDTLSITFIADPIAFVGNGGLRYKGNDSIPNDWSVNWHTTYKELFKEGAISNQVIGQFFPQHWYTLYPHNLSLDDSPDNESGAKRHFEKSNYADYYGEISNTSWKGYMTYLNKMTRLMRFVSDSAKQRNLTFGAIVQINSDEGKLKGEEPGWGLREPTNEEISVNNFLPVCYGAKQIFQFSYNTNSQGTDKFGPYYNRGLTTPNPGYTNKRLLNYYGQQKWQYVKELNERMKNIGNILYPPEDTNHHLKYDKTVTVNTYNYTCSGCNLPYSYISDIKSIHRNASYNFDEEPSCINCDPAEKRYWEIGFFNNPSNSNDKSKYFLALNKRTYPEINSENDSRSLKVKFNTSSLQGYNNWVLKDAVKDSVLSVFNKETNDYVSASIFLPGEGKLLKIAPVMQEGGTFVCDETVSTPTFTCKGAVLNNGYDLTISPNTTITFSKNAGIEMNGGSFECGEFSTEDNQVTFNGSDSSKGLVLSNLSSVGIYNTTLNDLKNDSSETAVLISNTYDINMKGCVFDAATNSGGVNISFTIDPPDSLSLNISECNFLMGSSGCDALSISSNGSPSAAVLLDWCTFTTSNDSSNALRLINVTGGAVKNSTFVNFNTTISALGSAFDLYNNKILGKTNSTGIFCADASNINLKPLSGYYLGGYNYIKNYGTSSSCINVNNSYFDINYGENDFDLNDLDNSKFLTGTLSGDPCDNVDATKNCFHEDSTTNVEANHSVTWYNNSDPVSFTFTGYSCELSQLENFFVLQYEGYNDTIYRSGGGEGGGFNPNKTLNTEENIYKSLKDTVNINLRKRNYTVVETNAKTILTQYPDSLESIGMVQKLYMASLNLDSTKIGLTKTFLENLISNNTQNLSLIKRAFYFIQKCKVKLGQYQSALEGFQYIMTQNPYTYEGLVASWDYAATYLLMGTGGSIQGDNEQTVEDFDTPADTLLSRMSKRDINTNRNSNTNKITKTNLNTIEQTTNTFYEKIKNTTKDDRSKQEEKVKTLEKTLESSKSTPEKNEAARELAVMKQIKEAVKIKKPNTVMNHIQIMNDDIKKVFGVGKKSTKESTNSLIPQTYQLYQNYPNPFNPTTKIAFDLPKDAKVKLVIYDILGREMKTIINNEFRSAGKYITEFNGSNMASGIYFARILVNEGKDFMAVKKMVLLK